MFKRERKLCTRRTWSCFFKFSALDRETSTHTSGFDALATLVSGLVHSDIYAGLLIQSGIPTHAQRHTHTPILRHTIHECSENRSWWACLLCGAVGTLSRIMNYMYDIVMSCRHRTWLDNINHPGLLVTQRSWPWPAHGGVVRKWTL